MYSKYLHRETLTVVSCVSTNYGQEALRRITHRKDEPRCLFNMFVVDLVGLDQDPASYRLECEIEDVTFGREGPRKVLKTESKSKVVTFFEKSMSQNGACQVHYHVKGWNASLKSSQKTKLQLVVYIVRKEDNALVAEYRGNAFDQLSKRKSSKFPRKGTKMANSLFAGNDQYNAEFEIIKQRKSLGWPRTCSVALKFQRDKRGARQYLASLDPLPSPEIVTSLSTENKGPIATKDIAGFEPIPVSPDSPMEISFSCDYSNPVDSYFVKFFYSTWDENGDDENIEIGTPTEKRFEDYITNCDDEENNPSKRLRTC